MHISIAPSQIAFLLSLMFLTGGAVNFAGPGFVVRAYERWDFPRKYYRVRGSLELLAGLFLAIHETNIWGVVLGIFVVFSATVTLLKHGQYGWALPGFLLIIALMRVAFAV